MIIKILLLISLVGCNTDRLTRRACMVGYVKGLSESGYDISKLSQWEVALICDNLEQYWKK